MTVYLIRHGLTAANERRLYCGAADPPLSASGAEGIRKLKDQGIYPPAQGLTLYTSGMLRAEQTLELIYGRMPHTALPAFAEMSFGDFEMRGYEELKENSAYLAWIDDRTDTVVCPGGESSGAFCERVFAAFDELQKTHQPAFLVTHGGVIARLMAHLFPDEPLHFYQWQPKPGEGYVLTAETKKAFCYQRIAGDGL